MVRKIIIILIVILLIILFTSNKDQKKDAQPIESIATNNEIVSTPSREIIVGKTSDAQFSSIQTALNNAKPGDTILVREGVYKEKIEWNTSGTKSSPITLKNYPGENPIIEPPGIAYKDYVALNAEWLILEGFEIRNGWDGVVINGSHNIVRNNYIHNNGDSCLEKEYCGQGILVVSARDILIENNRIERNGLTNYSPWHVHGIYLSDYYKKGMSDITIRGNTIREHGGAGVHVYNATERVKNLTIEQNILERNAFEILLTNVDNAKVTNNTITHTTYPQTDAPRTALLWLELSDNITFENNRFTYSEPNKNSIPSFLIYMSSQDKKELTFTNNVWNIPNDLPQITDQNVLK